MGSVLYTNQQAKFERKKGKKKLAISSNKLAASSMEASTPVLSSNLDSRWQVATSRTREQEGHGGCRCSRLGFWASVGSVRIGAGATFARSLPALFELGCAVMAGLNSACDSPPIFELGCLPCSAFNWLDGSKSNGGETRGKIIGWSHWSIKRLAACSRDVDLWKARLPKKDAAIAQS